MNLLDYQKSKNASGPNVTEFPKFSVLKDKIPKIPGVLNLPYVNQAYIFKTGKVYYEAFYGSRYQIVTSNGFVFYNPQGGFTQKVYTLTSQFANGGRSFDPFRQSIGSVPFQYPGKRYSLLKNSGDTYDFQGGFGITQHASNVENYNKGYVYDLPFNYIQGTGLKKIRFSTALESPFKGEAVTPLKTQYGSNLDPIGKKYKVFNVKKEQYIYVYTSVTATKGEFEFYKIGIDKHRLNFLSLFFEIPHKSDGYVYSTKGLDFISDETSTGLNRLTFDNTRSPFDYDRTIERVMAQTQGQTNFSHYENSLVGQSLDDRSKEISSIAFQRFSEIERQLYYDYSFDVESDISVAQYDYKPGGDGYNGAGAGFEPSIDKSFVQVGVPSGIPVNPKAMDSSLVADNGYLTADVTATYNYLNATWENSAPEIPEIAIPNIYDFAHSTDKGLDLKNSFIDLAFKSDNCLPYEDFIDIGKNKKLIFMGNEELLDSYSDQFKNNVPMYNTIEFDIYSNANREIHNALHSRGIYKDFLFSLLTNIYGPKSDYEIKYDLSQKTEVTSDPDISEAHKNVSKSLLAAELYFLSADDNDETRITSLKPSLELPDGLGQALGMKESDSISYDFERWYRYYLNHFEFEYNLEADALAGKPLIDKSKFRPFFTDYAFNSSGLKAPSELEQFQPVPVAAAISEVKSVIIDKMRDINEILSKKPSYSEPLMYRIEKTDISGNTIQTIFIPHFAEENVDIKQIITGQQPELTPKIKKLKYLDSQVKYGKVYRYKITQYRIVIGSDYRYVFATNNKTDKRAYHLGYSKKYDVDTIMKPARSIYGEGPMVYNANMIPEEGFIPVTAGQFPFQFYSKVYDKDQNQDVGESYNEVGATFPSKEGFPDKPIQFNKLAIFKSILYPNIRIEEVPYYEEEIVISDFPPLPPNVNFDPLIGKGSKILMTFENQTGDREEYPIIIEPSDAGLFSIQRTAQNRNAKTGEAFGDPFLIPTLRFKTDDFPKSYQIFKLDKPPSRYEDFAGNKYKDLDVEEATAIVEDLEPNRTFYYMFRAVDIHDNISNPSAVFSVQMTFNSGVYYPVVSTYEFNKKKVGYKFKEFQQYLKIEASLIQKLVNKKKSSINDASSKVKLPILGVGNRSLWNQKKFKFRIISKHTGKMMDLNIKFKTNHTNPIDPAKGC